MAYIRQNFEDGQTLKAEHLNAMEQGIADVSKHIVVSGGDTLTWDGNTSGLVCVADMLYKVSDVVLLESEVENIVLQTFAGTPCVEETVQIYFFDGAGMIAGTPEDADGPADMIGLYIVPAENFDMFGDGSIIMPYPGIYANLAFSLTIPGYTGFITEKLDPKVLPDALQFGVEEVALIEKQTFTPDPIDGNIFTPNGQPEIGDFVKVEFDGVSYTLEAKALDSFTVVGNLAIDENGEDTGEPFCMIWIDAEMVGVSCSDTTADHEISVVATVAKKLDEKFYDASPAEFFAHMHEATNKLFTNLMFVTEVTKNDLYQAAKNKSIRINLLGAAYLSPLQVIFDPGKSYAEVVVLNYPDGEIVSYYTAEYTG